MRFTGRSHISPLRKPTSHITVVVSGDVKTKNELTGKVLMLLDVVKVKGEKQSDNIMVLKRAFRNIPGTVLMFKCEANAYDILNADMIAILTETKAAPKAKSEAK